MDGVKWGGLSGCILDTSLWLDLETRQQWREWKRGDQSLVRPRAGGKSSWKFTYKEKLWGSVSDRPGHEEEGRL